MPNIYTHHTEICFKQKKTIDNKMNREKKILEKITIKIAAKLLYETILNAKANQPCIEFETGSPLV